jgi:hypothetical protein
MHIVRDEGVQPFYVLIPLGWFMRVFARLSAMGRTMFSSHTVIVRFDDVSDMSSASVARLTRLASTKLRIYYKKMKDFEEVDRLSRLTKESDPIADDVDYDVSPDGYIGFTIMARDPRRV